VTNLPCPVGFGLPTHPPVGLVYGDVSDADTAFSDIVAMMSIGKCNAKNPDYYNVYGTTMPSSL
jgi:hypothetical protein